MTESLDTPFIWSRFRFLIVTILRIEFLDFNLFVQDTRSLLPLLFFNISCS